MLRLALGGFENLEGHSCDRCGYSSRYEDVKVLMDVSEVGAETS